LGHLESFWKVAVVGCLKVLYQHLLGETEKLWKASQIQTGYLKNTNLVLTLYQPVWWHVLNEGAHRNMAEDLGGNKK
jgi:hypothetical protein